MLGGKGEFLFTFRDYPYFKCPKLLNYYCLITMGYHLGSCYPMVVSAKKNDILEMSLHHLACLGCYLTCYLINLPGLICVVNFIHDIADVTMNIARGLSETTFKNSSAIIFVFNQAVWGYTRLYVLPCLCYTLFFQAKDFAGPMLHVEFLYILGFLQACLICLHAYWWVMFVQILLSFAKSGKAEDTIGKIESNKDQAKEKI